MPDDIVPRHLVERSPEGLETMGKCADGWCAALDHAHMCCSIYELRPQVCRKFAMGGGYCRATRHEYRERHVIASTLVD